MLPLMCFGQEVSDSVVWNQIFSEQTGLKSDLKNFEKGESNDKYFSSPHDVSSSLNQIFCEDYNFIDSEDVVGRKKAILILSKAISIMEKADKSLFKNLDKGYVSYYHHLQMLYSNRASTFYNNNNPKSKIDIYERAIEDYTKAIGYFKCQNKYKKKGFNQKDRMASNCYHFRGKYYLAMDDFDKAIDDFDKAAYLYPKIYLECDVFKEGCDNNNSKACEYYNKHCK